MNFPFRFFLLPVLSVLAFFSARAQDFPDPGSVYPQPAYTADQFVDFMGLSAGPYEGFVKTGPGPNDTFGTRFKPELFLDLGIRHYRTCLKNFLTKPDTMQNTRDAYFKYGYKPMWLIDPHAVGTPDQFVDLLKQYGGSEVIGEIEGPNEVNNKFPPQELNLKYQGKTDEEAGAAFMNDYYKAIKADPVTKDIPVVAYTAIFTDYRLARPCDSYDCSNMHSYQGWGMPSSSLMPNFLSANHLLPEGGVIKPFVPTECGYNVDRDVSNHIAGNGNRNAQALNIPMLYGEYFRHGFIKHCYLFGMVNADGYGLLEDDQVTKRPSYYAVQSLVAALKDSSWNPTTKKWEGGEFTPKALMFTVEGAPRSLKSVTLQKHDGEYSILMWNEKPIWDSNAKHEIVNPPANVTLNFTSPVSTTAQVLRQDDSGAFKPAEQLTVSNGAMAVSVPAAMIIIRIKPGDVPAATVAAPTNLAGDATENSVKLTWSAPAGPAPVGYFVFRNGWCLDSTTDTTFFDKSPWIRPGLGYTYSVQAHDAAGNMSDRVDLVVQTAKKYPDYIITDLGLANPDAKPGDQIKLRGKMKNVGNGASPAGVPLTITFHMDGETIAWGGGQDLAPGQEMEVSGDGGPHPTPFWTVTPGAHVLEGHIDDIDRVPEESDHVNNIQDKTVVIGNVGAGEILGASQEAPSQVDLTSEGTEDWIHWGLNDPKAVNRKAKVNEISDQTTTGAGFESWTAGGPVRSSWSDGAPTAANPGTNASLWFNGVGGTYSFTAPADTSERVLKVYGAGLNGVTCSLTATLSDNSAPPYISKMWTGNSGHDDWAPVPGVFSVVYTIHYHAASAGQTLKIDYKLEHEPNRFQGQARLAAATLAKATSP